MGTKSSISARELRVSLTVIGCLLVALAAVAARRVSGTADRAEPRGDVTIWQEASGPVDRLSYDARDRADEAVAPTVLEVLEAPGPPATLGEPLGSPADWDAVPSDDPTEELAVGHLESYLPKPIAPLDRYASVHPLEPVPDLGADRPGDLQEGAVGGAPVGDPREPTDARAPTPGPVDTSSGRVAVGQTGPEPLQAIVEETPAAGDLESPVPATRFADQVTVRPGDSLRTISDAAYGTGDYQRALLAHNRDRLFMSEPLEPGSVLLVPDRELLRTQHPHLCPAGPRSERDDTEADRPTAPVRAYLGRRGGFTLRHRPVRTGRHGTVDRDLSTESGRLRE